MNLNKLSSENDLINNIQLKVKSLMTLLTELQQPSHNYKFNPSICNDIYMYIKNIETDCQRISINNKYNMFLNQDYQIHNSLGNII